LRENHGGQGKPGRKGKGVGTNLPILRQQKHDPVFRQYDRHLFDTPALRPDLFLSQAKRTEQRCALLVAFRQFLK